MIQASKSGKAGRSEVKGRCCERTDRAPNKASGKGITPASDRHRRQATSGTQMIKEFPRESLRKASPPSDGVSKGRSNSYKRCSACDSQDTYVAGKKLQQNTS